jgi:hypothetical protein
VLTALVVSILVAAAVGAISVDGVKQVIIGGPDRPSIDDLPTDPSAPSAPRQPAIVARTHSQGLSLALVVDPTSSTQPGLLRDFLNRSADALSQLATQPGQGPISVFVTTVGPNATDSRNVVLSFNLPSSPEQPDRRPTRERPPRLTGADGDRFCANGFSASRCLRRLIANRERDLNLALADEAAAQATYESALARFDEAMAAAAERAAGRGEQLRNLRVPAGHCSDVVGAIDLAARTLQAAGRNAAKMIWVQSDAEHTCGPRSLDAAILAGIDVAFVNWDCQKACVERAAWLEDLLRGSTSLQLLTPAVTAVSSLPGVAP